MKAAAIGTILPWTGDITRIPKGWLICNGAAIQAADYPLLAQAIGNTYGGAGFNLADFPTFPAQTISLPNIDQKALMDCDPSYFGAGAIDANIDTTAAGTVVTPFIGANTDIAAPNRTPDANTDILFQYAPQTLSGTITGATFNPGFGVRTIYTGARKLGRRHLPSHSHPTEVPSTIGLNLIQPGAGVSCSRTVTYNFIKRGGDDIDGNPQIQWQISYPGSTGFGNGSAGVVLGNIVGENPGPNLIPKEAYSHGISNWIGSADAPEPPDPFKGPSNPPAHNRNFNIADPGCPYGLGGTTVPTQNINFDSGGNPNTGDGTTGDQHLPYETFFNHSGIEFNKTVSTPGVTDIINAHDHATFDISYDRTGSSLGMPGSLTSNNVVANITPDNLPGALNITVTQPTPKVIVIYIIRAY